jgi:NADP-dependent 3-hydroxy acid dehydrogenase YdfG
MRHAVRDKVVLVTGASSGIGEATALALSEAGAKVAVGARRADRLSDLVKRAPGEVLALELDVTDEQGGGALHSDYIGQSTRSLRHVLLQ